MHRTLLPLAALCLLATGGCDYFRAAQPNVPTFAPFTPDYADPDAALQTISNAIQDKARTIGLTAYADAFAESTSTSTPGYHQLFWPGDVGTWQAATGRLPTGDWNRPLELHFFVYLVNLRPDEYRLAWEPDDPNPDVPGLDSWVVHRRYVLTTETTEGTQTSTLAVGFAKLTFLRVGGNWRIVRWEDRVDPRVSDPEQLTLGRRRLDSH